ncbi:MAG: hypothetical protein CMJ29_02345 [Phycisphaerae bacterium]|nr:hypothetical protein [Phycisphaerae bacterium]|tara:strand:+ start:567 stop:944 length:378 start_codon:yes stop_codon:yes gene_type:complete
MIMGNPSSQRFPISLGLMLVAEICILAALWMFHSRGFEAPALETLSWLWPICWAITIALCMTMASWGRQLARPASGVAGNGRMAAVMVLRLCIFSGLLVVPMVATVYAIVMLVLAMASASSASGS